MNRHSRERVAVSDAIQRGLVTARLLDDEDDLLGVDRGNALVVRRIDRLRTNVMNKLRVVNAFKAAASAAAAAGKD